MTAGGKDNLLSVNLLFSPSFSSAVLLPPAYPEITLLRATTICSCQGKAQYIQKLLDPHIPEIGRAQTKGWEKEEGGEGIKA